MQIDPRDEIWDQAYYLRYDTTYAEVVEEKLDARWSKFDHFSRIIVAVTSSGSALAGLAFWKDSNFIWMWPLLSSISAICALLSKQLNVAEKLRDHPNNCNALSTLRSEIENFTIKMKTNPNFSVESFQKELFLLRKKYTEEMKRIKHDIFLTASLERYCQVEVNKRMNINQLENVIN